MKSIILTWPNNKNIKKHFRGKEFFVIDIKFPWKKELGYAVVKHLEDIHLPSGDIMKKGTKREVPIYLSDVMGGKEMGFKKN